jgi:queuosine precursor transporter
MSTSSQVVSTSESIQPVQMVSHLPGLNLPQRVYACMTAIFVICLVIANLTGAMLFSFDVTLPFIGKIPVLLSSGIIPFPVTFILTDLLNEFYGPKGARFVTWVGFGMCFLVFVLLWIDQKLPLDSHTLISKSVFNSIANQYTGMFLASVTAYVVGQMLDIQVFHWIRARSGHRFIWLRATGSTVISQLVDSLVVTFIFFSGQMPFENIFHLAMSEYVWKFIIAVSITPLLYMGHGILRGLMPKQEQELITAHQE